MANKIHKGFNLLRDQLQEADKWDKIQNWVNGTARVIVIIVEFVVITCFGARIFMDRVARNLEIRLESNQNTLENLEDTELKLRQLQIDLQNYRGLWETSGEYSATVQEVYGYIPAIANTISVSIDKGVLNVSGNASKQNIGKLEGIVKSSPNYQDTLLTSYIPKDGDDSTIGDFQLKTIIKNYKRKIFVSVDKRNDSDEAPIENLEPSPETEPVEDEIVSPAVSPVISPIEDIVASPTINQIAI
ncbi:hypothetical protein KBD45_02720 [Candidatus Dojkabacteria bacterium]|nr:hypothetical protein [Candidatus Dojkabacteria bacterium]